MIWDLFVGVLEGFWFRFRNIFASEGSFSRANLKVEECAGSYRVLEGGGFMGGRYLGTLAKLREP